jgi:hypothetical protein
MNESERGMFLFPEGHGLNEKPTTPDPVYNPGIRVFEV